MTPRNHTRGGRALVAALAAVILLLLGVVAYLLATRTVGPPATGAGSGPDTTPVAVSGQTITRDQVKTDPAPPPVKDPELVRTTLPTGGAYRVVQKAGLAARGQDPDWGNRDLVKIGLAAEQVYTRRVESNDGVKVVEVREYDYHRVVKILSGDATLTVTLGSPEAQALAAFHGLPAGELRRADDRAAVLRAVAGPDPAALAADPATKVFVGDSLLSGKTVRVTSVDGRGVVSVEPIGCGLNAWERDHLFNKDPLATTRLLAEQARLKPGEEATLPGRLFGEILEAVDPRAAPRVTGHVVVRREPDGAGPRVVLTVPDGRSELRVAEAGSAGDVYCVVRPAGRMVFTPGQHLLEEVVLRAPARVEALPAGGLLGRAVLLDEPRLDLTYSARKQ